MQYPKKGSFWDQPTDAAMYKYLLIWLAVGMGHGSSVTTFCVKRFFRNSSGAAYAELAAPAFAVSPDAAAATISRAASWIACRCSTSRKLSA